ncbi:Ig-like domain-containing protein [Polluticaenibacter yanchengensis]|uniref:Gliding motility-associated C-terminal domain-containing protein n=1 Tax=Polluticaenibacter yanchengensis TaxID=3014562 RepID=A0ABT4UL05_9BACT|nr:gliding motility-associated C-terminal domain-containing protein [Chitinophagaceae bacterium LY-5]
MNNLYQIYRFLFRITIVLCFFCVNAYGQVSGTFTINKNEPAGGGNFQSFSAAIQSLSSGVNGAVVFNVTSSNETYGEQVIINRIPGASSLNSITINGNGNTISFAPSNTNQRAVLKLDSADHFIIDNLKIDATGGTYGIGIQLMNSADSNVIKNCSVLTDLAGTSANFAGIAINPLATSAIGTGGTNNSNGNIIENNTIEGGYYGMTMCGSTGGPISNIFRNNTVRNFYYYGIYLTQTDGALIEGNDLSRPTRTNASLFNGIYLTTNSINTKVNANRIHNSFGGNPASTSAQYPIYLTAADALATGPNIISNNLIYNINGAGLIYGLYNSSSDFAYYYHNTVVLDNQSNTSSVATRAVYQVTLATGIEFKNNIFIVTRTGGGASHAIYMGTATTTFESNNNNIIVPNDATSYIGYSGSALATMADWRSTTGQDAASVSIDPFFVDAPNGNYQPSYPAFDNLGRPTTVTKDFLNATRNATTPDIGAYEFSPQGCTTPPVPGTVISSLPAPICVGTEFTLSVDGGDAAVGLSFQWQRSTDNGANWQNIAGANGRTITLTQSITTQYRIVYTCNSVSANSNVLELVSPAAGGISGTFTINKNQPTSATNFKSFNEAYLAMKCGISGAVVFNVTPNSGPYEEQLIMDAIPGTSVTRTVTFNGNGNTITFNSTNTNERGVIKLNGADHITFDSLVVAVPGTLTTEYGYGFHLINNADSNTIRNSKIVFDYTSTSSNYAGIVISNTAISATSAGSATGTGNMIINNTIDGGYYGITVIGGVGFPVKAVIRNNKVKDFYYYGIYVTNNEGTVIEGNDVYRPDRANTSIYYGIYMGTNTINTLVNANKLFNTMGADKASTSAIYGIYTTAADATAAAPNIISNNLMYDFNGSGTIYAIYNSSSDNAKYFHNTISLENTANSSSSLTRAFYQITAAVGIEFKNNIVKMNRGGTGANFALYWGTATTTFSSNHNVFHLTNAQFGYLSAAIATFDAWKSATPHDANSLESDPMFLDVNTANYRPNNVAIIDKGTPVGVLSDILGEVRSTTTPDVGAYEFTILTCKEPPTPGTVLTTMNPVCIGQEFTLSIDGGEVGAGLSLQWQVSADGGNTWTNISGQTNTTLTTSQLVTSSYRVQYTCGATTVPSAAILINSPQGLSGTYTINKNQPTAGRNYASFNDAYVALNCGISGSVVFDVVAGSGPYNEQLLMNEIKGTSASSTITFNGNGNTISYLSANTNERAVIRLNNVDYITFNNLVIEALGTTTTEYGWGVYMTNDADFVTFRNCTIKINQSSTSTNYSGFVVSGSATSATATTDVGADNFVFENNTISGGYYSMAFSSGNNIANMNASIKGNTFKDFYFYGLYVRGSFNASIDSNLITRPERTSVSTFYGIYATGINTKANITRNIITNPFGGNKESVSIFYGIYFASSDALATLENVVSNNLIYNTNGSGTVYGIYNTGSDNVWYYHNTIHLDGAATLSTHLTRAFYQTTAAGGIEFKNNNITISRTGPDIRHMMYLNTPASEIVSNNNNFFYFTQGNYNNVGFKNATDFVTLNEWQVATNHDTNSVANDPMYEDIATGNFKPSNASINDLGAPLTVPVTIDIKGEARNIATPDIGAFEFEPERCIVPPVAGTATVSETPVCENTVITLNVTGNSSGLGQSYQWQASTDLNGTYANISDVITNPLFNVTASSSLYYRLAVTCNANTSYSTAISVPVTPALQGGVYTIDSEGQGDYLNFTEAVAAMSCGITSSVVFNVTPNSGPYNEQIVIDTIRGTSATSTVTFNGNGNVLKFSSSNTNERAVLTLRRADFITFDSLTIDASGTGTFGWGVLLTNNADSNTFKNCTIDIPQNATTTNYAGIVISSSATSATTAGNAFCDGNVFSNNRIKGGYYGISSMGSNDVLNENNIFVDNIIEDFYIYGIYIGRSNNNLIENNIIRRTNRASVSTFYGVYSTGVSYNLKISKNRIYDPFAGNPTSTSSAYGFYFTASDASETAPVIVSNNLLYNFNVAGTVYGIYNSSSDYIKAYHNTFSFDHTANTSTTLTYGFYQITAAVGLDFKNNMVTVTRGGTGTKYGYYFSTSTTEFESDNNNFYIAGAAGINNFGYISAARATIDAWRAFTNKDARSSDINPVYRNIASQDYAPTEVRVDNTGTPVGISTDILGNTRDAVTPDMGAFEVSLELCKEPVVAGTSVSNPTSDICLGQTITLGLTGNSTGGLQTYVWQKSGSATGGTWTDISDTLYAPAFTYELSDTLTYFRAAVRCGNSIAYSTPVYITLNPLMASGDYTIDPSQPTAGRNFASFTAAVTAMQCGIEGPVRFLAVPGTYNEQLVIRKVPGASTTAGVTFLSNNNNAASVILNFNGTVANNYILKFDGAQHITFRDITFNTLNSTYGNAIEFATSAANDTILNNVINVPVSTTTTNNVVGVFGTGLTGSNNVIKGNTINNGSKGIYLSGTTLVSNNYVLDSNTISGSYQYNIYAANINNIDINKNKITKQGVLNTSSYGIYTTNCDSIYNINNNDIKINNTGITVYGIYLTGNQASLAGKGSVSNNIITAETGNTGNMYGVYITTSTYADMKNNAIAIKTTGTTSYGVYSTGTTGGILFYNNSVQSAATSTTANVTAYFSKTTGASGIINIRNNIFSNTGGGKAYQMVNPGFIHSDYNLFYTNGPSLIQLGTAAGGNFGTLKQWVDTSSWDVHSIVYKPAFVSESDLRPDVAAPEVWAIHGRGVQIDENNVDINGNARPVDIEDGVPDLGAYEFLPTSVPVALTATPATPVANTVQTFMLGTDTVTKITWGADVPATVTGRRYSGVKPDGLATNQQFMYFYTDFTHTGTAPKDQIVKQFYLDPWLGTIPDERIIKLGATTPANVWEVMETSSVITNTNIITDTISNLYKYTGLTDGKFVTPPIVLSGLDSSNRGTNFWVGYGHHQYFESNNAQDMVLYLGAGEKPATVTVRVNGTSWERQYQVPANSVLPTDLMPKFGLSDSRLLSEGLSEKGISIVSDEPITATAHIYANTNSGATMLMPVGTYGYEYYALTSKQYYANNTYSWFYVVAAYDSTVVEITPSKPTLGGRPAGVPFTVHLKKGEIYQVLGAIESGVDGYDLTGSRIKSIGNEAGKCYPVAVFSGSSRTNIGCGTSRPTANGDNLIQQNFAFSVWGRRYLTAPTSHQTDATQMNGGIFKVMVKDPATVVRRNGQVLTGLIDNLYYQFDTNMGEYIEADKPIMVAQFMPSSATTNGCGYTGQGDPNMIYISPMEQGIKEVALYRNTESAITVQYLTLIIPEAGLSSLTIDNSNTFDYVYDHPALTGYKVVVKRWLASRGQTVVKSDSAFTATTYGLGSAESYGYNAGTLVKNLNTLPAITNVFNPVTGTENPYTCTETPFRFKFLSTVEPTSIIWKLDGVEGLEPNQDVIDNNPVYTGTEERNGTLYYEYTLNSNYVINKAGDYKIRILITHPDIEGCSSSWETVLDVKVYDKPKVDFTFSNICLSSETQLLGTAETVNNTPISQWTWSFENANDTLRTQNAAFTFGETGTYKVKLSIISNEGCISDTTKSISIISGPDVEVVAASVVGCPGGEVTFAVKDPVTGISYKWYTTATGGTSVHTGNTYTVIGISGAASYWVESDNNGCTGKNRTQVQVTMGVGPVVELVQNAVVGCIGNSVTLTVKEPVAGVVYTWYNAATGGTALGTGSSYTITNLPGAGTYYVSGNNGGCISAARAQATVTIGVGPAVELVNNTLLGCVGGSVTFQVKDPVAGVTYNWFTTATGGTAIHSGTTYTISNIPGSATYWVGSNNGGCISAVRAQATVNLLPQLAIPVAVLDSAGVNMLRFRWAAVPNATGYEVSTNNGVTWTVPSSGATGLTHEITGLAVGTLVELQVRALGGCEPSVSLVVSGRTLTDRVYVPNSFSPNGDGINDVLRVKANGLRQLRFVVFNQWGQKISESTDQNRAWDGTHKGKQQPVGVYFYTFEATLADGSVIQRKGSVNLIR